MSEIVEPCPPCSVEQAIGMIGGKWKLYLIRVLVVSGPQRFNSLLAALEGISHKVLTENLRALEESGVIFRKASGGIQTYAMTESGVQLQPILHAMGVWAESHIMNATVAGK